MVEFSRGDYDRALVGLCDGGGCNDQTAAVVLTPDDGWLSLCATHAISELVAGIIRG